MAITIETKTVEISFDVEVECAECGDRLEAEFEERTRDYRVIRTLRVTPCPKCLDGKYGKGMEDGKEEAGLEAEEKK